MSYCVHLLIAFEAYRNEPIAELARKHLVQLSEDCPLAVRWYLGDLAKRTGINYGPKGGLSIWGMIGNHLIVDKFVYALSGFWKDLLTFDSEYPGTDLSRAHRRNNILIFCQYEQTDQAEVFEIGWDNPYEKNRRIVVQHFEKLPFSWLPHI